MMMMMMMYCFSSPRIGRYGAAYVLQQLAALSLTASRASSLWLIDSIRSAVARWRLLVAG